MTRPTASSASGEPDVDVQLTRAAGAVGDSLTVAVWTLVSRVTGFGRVAVTAAVLGPTYLGNTFQATNSLPNIIYYGLLAGSLVSSLLVPALVGHIDGGDRRACERVAGGALGLVVLGLTAVVPVTLAIAPLLLELGALGSVSAEAAAAQERVARLLLVMLLPQVFLYAVVACSSAVMHAHRRFALAAAAPAMENIGCIAVLGAAVLLYPGQPAVENVPVGELLLLGLGTTGAVALHALVQWLGARHAGVTLRPTMGWRDAEVRRLLRRSLPAIAQASLEAVQLLCILFVVNRVAGGVVAYQVAAHFYLLPIALGATPVALSLLPRLARLDRWSDRAPFRDTAVRGLRFALFIAAPAAVVLAVLAPVLAAAVSFGRMSAEGGTALVAAALVVLAPAVLGETAFLVGTYASYARGGTGAPLRSMVWKVSTCLAVLGVAITADGPSVIVVAGLGVSLAATVGAVHRVRALLADLPRGDERLVPSLARIALAAAVMAGPLWICARLLDGVENQLAALGGGVAACLVGAAAYLGTLALLRAEETGWLRGALRRPGDGGGAP
jgi:putative peptidoglycan lipid II flippase